MNNVTINHSFDASYDKDAQTCTIDMVIRNYRGEFIEGKVVSINKPASVFEAECLGVREALSF